MQPKCIRLSRNNFSLAHSVFGSGRGSARRRRYLFSPDKRTRPSTLGDAVPLAIVLLLSIMLATVRSARADTGSGSADDPAPDEVSYFGERVYSLRQWPPDWGYGISYRKIFTPYFAASLAYLNDAHFPGHHRDGVTAEAWLPIIPLSNRITLNVGGGPFYYYDTVFAQNSGGYADAHGWAWLASLDATIQPWKSGPWSHLFIEVRLDYTAPAKSIQTTSVGLGLGYRGFSDIHKADPNSAEGFAANEIVASYWKTVTNSLNSSSHTSRAEAIDYRRQIWHELRASVGFLNEGDTRLIRRNGIMAEGWLEPSFGSGLWSIGAGFGFYSAIDKYRPAPGRHVSEVVSATVSVRPIKNLDIRFLWHRIVTDYNRDADILLWGLGYRF
jgi:hypothetical protein